MQTRSDPSVPAYAVGQTVYGAIDDQPGTVVDVSSATFSVVWNDGKAPVTYPQDTIMVQKAWPWE